MKCQYPTTGMTCKKAATHEVWEPVGKNPKKTPVCGVHRRLMMKEKPYLYCQEIGKGTPKIPAAVKPMKLNLKKVKHPRSTLKGMSNVSKGKW